MAIRTIAALVIVAFAAVPARAQRGLDEHEVKAAFLYNFMKFVEWPRDDKSAPLAMCVAGRDPVRDVLSALASGKPVNGRQVVVRGLGDGAEARSCHVIFIGAAESERHAAIVHQVRNSAVLTVGETRQFVDDGGLVRFYVDANRVRFAIDPAGAQRVGLKISSQLLSLSKLGG